MRPKPPFWSHMWTKQISFSKSTAHGSGSFYLLLMSRPSIIVHRELKIFLWVQSAKVSPLTRLGLFFLLQGSQGWKLPASQRGSPQTSAGTEEEGGLFWAVSCTGWSLGVSLLWLLSGNELPRSGRVPASAQPSTNYPLCLLKQSDWNHKGLILLIPPQTLSITFFPPHLLFMFAEFCWPSCHTSIVSPSSFYLACKNTSLSGLHAPPPRVPGV